MFGPFHGPLAEGKYHIRASGNLALCAPSIVNDAVATMLSTNVDDRDEFRIWILEYGNSGYRIKNQASGNTLTYTPWAVPSRLIGQDNHVMVSADSPVEWELVQTTGAGQRRAFQLRVVAGNQLKPTDDIALGWSDGKFHLMAGASGTSFEFRGRAVTSTIPSSIDVKDGTMCLIRSVYFPHIAVEHSSTAGNPVIGRPVSNETQQVWIFEQGAKGFKIKNGLSNKYLGRLDMPSAPCAKLAASVVCQDNASGEWAEWIIVKSTQGFELRAVTNSNYLVELWDLDARNSCWINVGYNPVRGNGNTGEQWIFTEVGGGQ
ncbi:hypothetical protein FRB93_005528 [Tulasnella sp. JGI-2019a]|nr:hypothetical protein FRB93_005528 [Tulasnella sp. JGI-2019a]